MIIQTYSRNHIDALVMRQATLDTAFRRHPNRFKGKNPRPHALPEAVWINPPVQDKITPQQPLNYSVNS